MAKELKSIIQQWPPEIPMNTTTSVSDCSNYELDSTKNESSCLNWSQISESSAVQSNFESISDEGIEANFKDLVPVFNGYQLIGDSQLVRFSETILGLQREFTHSSSGSIGLCVSGQKISELHRRVWEKIHPVGEQVILLIGTNDLLKGTKTNVMCVRLKFLIEDILLTAKKIVVLTLPPVPKLSHSEEHWNRLDDYNDYIKSLPVKYQGKLTVADICPFFYRSQTKFFKLCRLSYFEKWYLGGTRKDLIHINEEGFKVIRNFLLNEIL
ncbi:hypothetical protein LSTR_LSTR011496 [Laodelphax striatellus]|uniref:OSK domain-containing protein n=1 Tax=Laodelphax striatellus TaxID=195883 RepID=A0A482WFE8_LAOST|nr:hypothetical protein LSTR_LSTR011496 [Laodelphax striatellus]